MEREQIESESRNIAEYFQEYWTSYVDPAFDRTFSLRNWTTVLTSIVLHYNKKISNNKNNIKNINNYKNKLIKTFKNKKILHIGCGYGYFLEVVKELEAIPFGIEQYLSFPENLNIIKAKIEDLQDNSSELSKSLNGEKFDAIVAHDVFVPSVIKNDTNKIVNSLKKYLQKSGIMVFGNQNEESSLKKDTIEKYGFKVEVIENIMNPHGEICNQIMINK